MPPRQGCPGNPPGDKYLDVKEAEASLLPPRICVAGLEVSLEAGQSKSHFGIATIKTPSRFFEKHYRRDNPPRKFATPVSLRRPPYLAIHWDSLFQVFILAKSLFHGKLFTIPIKEILAWAVLLLSEKLPNLPEGLPNTPFLFGRTFSFPGAHFEFPNL